MESHFVWHRRITADQRVKVENRDSKCDFLKQSKYFFFT